MNSKSHEAVGTILNSATPQELREYMDKSGLFLVPNSDLSDNHLIPIMKSLTTGAISIDEKNKLIISIILNQLKIGNRYLVGIKHPKWDVHCSTCSGKGFNVIMETIMKVDPCKGNSLKNAIPCGGTGIKTSPCNRCNGLKLNDILRIRNEILIGEANINTIANYANFAKIRIDKISPKFIENNGTKTFRVFNADSSDLSKNGETSDDKYYFISKAPCKSCKGTGFFIHDRKNIKCASCNGLGHDIDKTKCENCDGTGHIDGEPIKCPGCSGKGFSRKQLVSTNVVKSFITCKRCEGLGTIVSNPVINLKTIPEDVKAALEKSGLLK